MITDSINNTVKHLNALQILESSIKDAEKKENNDREYGDVVSSVATSLKKVEVARNDLEYHVTRDAYDLLVDTVDGLQKVIEAGAVESDSFSKLKYSVSHKLNPVLKSEWDSFHAKQSSRVKGKLNTVRDLVDNTEDVKKIDETVENTADWDNISTLGLNHNLSIERLSYAIKEVDNLVDELNLSPAVNEFIQKVSGGHATVADVTPEVMEWITSKGMCNRFVIRFGN